MVWSSQHRLLYIIVSLNFICFEFRLLFYAKHQFAASYQYFILVTNRNSLVSISYPFIYVYVCNGSWFVSQQFYFRYLSIQHAIKCTAIHSKFERMIMKFWRITSMRQSSRNKNSWFHQHYEWTQRTEDVKGVHQNVHLMRKCARCKTMRTIQMLYKLLEIYNAKYNGILTKDGEKKLLNKISNAECRYNANAESSELIVWIVLNWQNNYFS